MEKAAGFIIAVFFIGAVPFGWLIARLLGVKDLRKLGSANTGATNVTRNLGWGAGAATFFLDAFKSIGPILLLKFAFSNDDFGIPHSFLAVVSCLVAVLGHCFSPFLSFRGGKGVSTALGMFLVLNPWVGVASLVVYIMALLITRVSALGSLFALLCGLAGFIIFPDLNGAGYWVEVFCVAAVVGVVLARHKKNWENILGASLVFATIFLLSSDAVAARVVALMPGLAETVVALGKEGDLVGAPEFSVLPLQIRGKTKILGPYNRISVESVYGLKPDLVLASTDGNDEALVRHLERLHVRVLTFNMNNLVQIDQSIRRIAQELGITEGDVKKSRLPFSKFHEFSISPAPRSRAKVFIQIGWEPLVTVNGNTFVHETVAKAGGANIFASSKIKYPRPNIEEVITRNPDVILICDLTGDGIEAEKAKNFWKKFSKLKAVRENRLYVVKGAHLVKPGLELLTGFEELKKLL